MANELKKQGLVDSLTITDAQGNANTQIQQIQSMIDAKLDAIIVDAGSATALDRVIADAVAAALPRASFERSASPSRLVLLFTRTCDCLCRGSQRRFEALYFQGFFARIM